MYPLMSFLPSVYMHTYTCIGGEADQRAHIQVHSEARLILIHEIEQFTPPLLYCVSCVEF